LESKKKIEDWFSKKDEQTKVQEKMKCLCQMV
jgi:hypothetical protein